MKLHQIGLVTSKTALTPAAIKVDNVIRIFAGFVYDDGMSRIHTIDVNPLDPSEVYAVSEEPVLDVGAPGMFDGHGVIPAYVTRYYGDTNTIYLYYSGFRRSGGGKFELYTGRASGLPGFPMQRMMADLLHPGMYIPDKLADGYIVQAGFCGSPSWNCWAAGKKWQMVKGKPHLRYAVYSIWFQNDRTIGQRLIVRPKGKEYRIGKPHTWGDRMLCTAYTRPDNDSYLVYLTHNGGGKWTRQPLDITGAVFPSPIYAYRCGDWVFFNGAGNGVGGIGYGRLED